MAKQQHPLSGFERPKKLADSFQMLATQFPPLSLFRRQDLRFKNRQGDQSGNNSHEQIIAKTQLPKRLQTQSFLCLIIAGQTQSAQVSPEWFFPKLVIAKSGAELARESPVQFLQAFCRAGIRRRIADANESRVT